MQLVLLNLGGVRVECHSCNYALGICNVYWKAFDLLFMISAKNINV